MRFALLLSLISFSVFAADGPIEVLHGTAIKWKCGNGEVFGVSCEKDLRPLTDQCLKGAPAGCLALHLNETNSYCAEKIAFKCVTSKSQSTD